MLTKEQRIVEHLMMFDLVVMSKFRQLIKGNLIPEFLCTHEHEQATAYALDLSRKGLLREAYNRALQGVL